MKIKTGKKYQIILADPAWSYKDKCNSGKRGAGHKYPTMSIQDLRDLEVYRITEKDCWLFLWVTFPLLQEGLDVIKSWKFEYKTLAFDWTKLNKKAKTPFFGMGNYTRACNEICLLATRGKVKRASASVSCVVQSPIREHSKKPDEVRNRIVELCGDLPRIELFATERSPGWDAMGFDINGKDIKKEINKVLGIKEAEKVIK